MLNKKIQKTMAVTCTMLLLGVAACKSEPVKNDPKDTGRTVVSDETEGQRAEADEEKKGQSISVTTTSPEIRELIETVTRNQVTETTERTATVRLSDSGAEITGTGCEMDGNRLKIKEAGGYEISGTLSNGSIYVNVDNESEVHLILNGVTVHNETSAALFCKKAAKVTITLAEGTANLFSDGASYVFEEGADEPDATIYAKHDLVINGSGKLMVTSVYGDALKGKDCLFLLGGEFTVDSAEDGIVGRDLLYIANGTFTVNAAADALKASNDVDASLGNMIIDGGVFTLTAETDGIQAENTLMVNGGVFVIKTGGGAVNAPEKKEEFGFGGGGRGFGDWGNRGQTFDTETEDTSSSAKGLKAGVLLNVTGGTFEFDTCDDALHGNTDVTVTGGDYLIATGDDGMHADGKLLIEGSPKIRITKSYEGLEGLEIVINGGNIDITASDDGLNAAGGNDGSGFGRGGMGMFGEGQGEVAINGGTILVNAEGDGLDSNGNLAMNGGVVTVFGPISGGNGVLDYGGTFVLNGGTLLAMGSSDMAQTPANTSGQYSLAAVLTSRVQAGSKVEIAVNGKTVFSEEVPKQFSYIVASAKDFTKDAKVSVAVNGEECYEGSLADVVTCFGFSGGMGGFGGNGNQGGFGGNKGNRGDNGGFGNGRVPQMPGGEMPQMPEGEWPDFSNGERPQMPNGGMSLGTDV